MAYPAVEGKTVVVVWSLNSGLITSCDTRWPSWSKRKGFVARKGIYTEIWTYNGSNFVASNKELRAMWQEAGQEVPGLLVDQLANDGTQWKFTPP